MEILSWNDLVLSGTPTATFPFFLALNRRERLLTVVHRASSLLVTMTYFDDHYKRLNTTGHGTGKRRSAFLSALPSTDRNTCNGGRKI